MSIFKICKILFTIVHSFKIFASHASSSVLFTFCWWISTTLLMKIESLTSEVNLKLWHDDRDVQIALQVKWKQIINRFQKLSLQKEKVHQPNMKSIRKIITVFVAENFFLIKKIHFIHLSQFGVLLRRWKQNFSTAPRIIHFWNFQVHRQSFVLKISKLSF